MSVAPRSSRDVEIPPETCDVEKGCWLKAVLLVVATLLAYAPALRGAWLWDDNTEITGNLLLRDPHGWWRAWLGPTGPDYFPLKTTVQWLQWQLWGGTSTVGYHLFSLGLHLVSALLLWRILRRLDVRWAWFGGMLFALHPMAVESVAWIAELKNTLSLPLLLAACDSWLDAETSSKRGPYLRSLAWFVAALLAKTSVVTFPVFLVAWILWRRRALRLGDLGRVAPFFAASLILGALTVWFQQRHAIAGWMMPATSWGPRFNSSLLALGFYGLKALVPWNLMPVYPAWSLIARLLGWILPVMFAVLAIVAWRARRRWGGPVLLGGAWFVLPLLPIAGLVSMAYLHLAPVADHFAYLSLVGLAGLLAVGWGSLDASLQGVSRLGCRAGAMILVGVFGGLSFEHAKYFAGPEALWSEAVRRNPASWVAHENLGTLRLAQGNASDAVVELKTAATLAPHEAGIWVNLGTALGQLGHGEEAVAALREAVRLDPELPDAHYNLANLLVAQGDPAGALPEYAAALRLSHQPAPDLVYNYGNALLRTGNLPAAEQQLREAVRLMPDGTEPHLNLGTALAAQGKLTDAVREFEAAVRLAPMVFEAQYSLADALAETERWPESVPPYQAALRLGPENPDVHARLGLIWLRQGRDQDARTEFETALRIDPGHAEARAGLADVARRARAVAPGRH